MNFLIDAQLPPALCGRLRAKGYLASHVAEVGLLAASDDVSAAKASAENLVLISKDEDFAILRLPDRFCFVWLRIGNATNRALVAWLEPRCPGVLEALEAGERFVEVR